MSCSIRLTVRLWLCFALIFGMASGCSPEQYKKQADEEVYKIIDSKWQNDFGKKANYTISSISPKPDDIQIINTFREPGVINLAQAVARATTHNRNYQTQKERLYLVGLDLTLARHQFTQKWFGTIDSGYTTADGIETFDTDTGLGFNQLLADGAQISTNIALDWARFLSGDPQTSLTSILSANITQPLLRGSGRKIVQENLTQAERNLLYEIRSFNRYRKTFVVSIITDYYRLLQQRDSVTNAENNYSRRVESKTRLEMEADAGRRNRFEVDQAQQDVLNAKDNYIRQQQTYKQQLDELKIRLALPIDLEIQLNQNELKTLEKSGVNEQGYSLNTAIETGLLRRLDLANSADRIGDGVRKVMVASDDFGAELNLIGSASASSNEKNDYNRLQFQRGTYKFGIEADMPFDRKKERNAYCEALIVLEQSQRTYLNDMEEAKLEVRQAYRQLQEAAERYLIQKNSLSLAEKRVESTSLLLEAGRSTTRDLLESQNALLQAQNSTTATLVDHAIAKLNFFRDIGILQVKPDGMWEQR